MRRSLFDKANEWCNILFVLYNMKTYQRCLEKLRNPTEKQKKIEIPQLEWHSPTRTDNLTCATEYTLSFKEAYILSHFLLGKSNNFLQWLLLEG